LFTSKRVWSFLTAYSLEDKVIDLLYVVLFCKIDKTSHGNEVTFVSRVLILTSVNNKPN